MFNLNSNKSPKANQNGQIFSGFQVEGLVHAVTLTGIDNPFDANELWDHTVAFSREKRIKHFLDSSMYHASDKQIFSHVIVELPDVAIAKDQRKSSGKKRVALEEKLVESHMSSFKGRFEEGRTPRYSVRAASDLAPSTVRVRFGDTIYVRDSSEQSAWELHTSMDGVMWDVGPSMMEKQRQLMFGSNVQSASDVIAHWPFGDTVSLILVNNIGSTELDLSSEPFNSIQIEQDHDLDCFVLKNDNKFFYLKTKRLISDASVTEIVEAPSNLEQVLAEPTKGFMIPTKSIQTERKEPSLSDVSDTGLEESDHFDTVSEPLQDKTFVANASVSIDEDRTYVPSCSEPEVQIHTISLIGIGIQRVSLYEKYKVSEVGFAFDGTGMVVPGLKMKAADILGFFVNQSDTIQVVTNSGSRLVEIGENLPLTPTRKISLAHVPAEMNADYLAWCPIPNPLKEPISTGKRTIFGRSKPAFKKLRVLSEKNVVRANGSVINDGDMMGVSSSAFSVEIIDEGLLIMPLKESIKLWHLDENLKFVECMDIAVEKKAFVIPEGHHIVAGHYVLRYN